MKVGVDYAGITIVYFCHDGDGNFLMQLRGENCRDENGRWDIGAGALDTGETVESTLSREINEEYKTDVMHYEFIGFRDVLREHNGERTHWIALDHKVLLDRKKVENGEPNKFNQIGWFRFSDLPRPTHSQFPAFLEKYGNKLF